MAFLTLFHSLFQSLLYHCIPYCVALHQTPKNISRVSEIRSIHHFPSKVETEWMKITTPNWNTYAEFLIEFDDLIKISLASTQYTREHSNAINFADCWEVNCFNACIIISSSSGNRLTQHRDYTRLIEWLHSGNGIDGKRRCTQLTFSGDFQCKLLNLISIIVIMHTYYYCHYCDIMNKEEVF